MTSPVTETHGPCVNRVTVKAPPFWPDKPALWFAQIESQFVLAGVTADDTRYHHVLAQLDGKYIAEVEDVVISPPSSGKYERIKTELISRLTTPQAIKLQRLLDKEEQGDRTPSRFLRHLRSLGGAAVSDVVLKTLWLSRLPQQVQVILLAASPDTDLNELAQTADRVSGSIAGPQVCATTSSTPMELLTQQVASLASSVEALRTSRSRDKAPRSEGQRGMAPRSNTTSTTGLCWYHAKFGAQARRCNPPCNYQGNGRAGQ